MVGVDDLVPQAGDVSVGTGRSVRGCATSALESFWWVCPECSHVVTGWNEPLVHGGARRHLEREHEILSIETDRAALGAQISREVPRVVIEARKYVKELEAKNVREIGESPTGDAGAAG